ncbi:hypothetical protein [Amycolatopsis sp. MtRt-6]|nr:hypothetical protein [Amycolatopsis sp. MtRt-6]
MAIVAGSRTVTAGGPKVREIHEIAVPSAKAAHVAISPIHSSG